MFLNCAIYKGFGKHFNFDMCLFRGSPQFILKIPVRQISEIGQKYSFLGDISQVQTWPLKTPVDFF